MVDMMPIPRPIFVAITIVMTDFRHTLRLERPLTRTLAKITSTQTTQLPHTDCQGSQR